jgi:DUF1680 family protein
MDEVAGGLIAAQGPDGYLGTYLEKDRWTSWDVWSHKYCLIGFLSYHRVTGYRPALDACRRAGDLLCATFGEGKRDIIRAGTHVGMASTSVLEPMALLYAATGESRYLEFCRYLLRAWDQPHGPKILARQSAGVSVAKTANGKAYEMMSNLVGLLELYRVTGVPDYLDACTNAWKDIVAHQEYATGTASWAEHFQEAGRLAPGGEQRGTTYVAAGEGCVTVTWEQINAQLLRLTGEAKYGDELERTTYNALLAAQSPVDGSVSYFVPMLGRKRYGEVSHGIPPDVSCCASSIPRGVAMIPSFSLGVRDGQPAIVLYASGERSVTAQGKDGPVEVGILVKGDYPANGRVDVSLKPARTESFALLLRVPRWCGRFVAQAGGRSYTGKPGGWLAIERDWEPGAVVRIDMDLPIFTVAQGPAQGPLIAIQRGPQVLALDTSLAGSDALPDGWFGRQSYDVSGRQGTSVRRMRLVPIAEAGQTKADYEAVFRDFTLDAEEAKGSLRE